MYSREVHSTETYSRLALVPATNLPLRRGDSTVSRHGTASLARSEDGPTEEARSRAALRRSRSLDPVQTFVTQRQVPARSAD